MARDFRIGFDGGDMEKPKENASTRWTTLDEIRFLNGLGGWKGAVFYSGKLLQVKNLDQMKRLNLLAKYKTSMKLRKKWGSVDPQNIFRYLP